MIRNLVDRVRRNHALEHATVAVLLESGVRPPLGGYSTRGGYFVLSRASKETLEEAAQEALLRLRAGESGLAVSAHCGTNIVTGAVLSGLLSAAILRTRRPFIRVPAAAAAIVCAALLSRPLGMALQRRYTTSAKVECMAIVGIRRVWPGPLALYRVTTKLASG